MLSLGTATNCFSTIWRSSGFLCSSYQPVLETYWRRWFFRTASSIPTFASSPTTWTLTTLWVPPHLCRWGFHIHKMTECFNKLYVTVYNRGVWCRTNQFLRWEYLNFLASINKISIIPSNSTAPLMGLLDFFNVRLQSSNLYCLLRGSCSPSKVHSSTPSTRARVLCPMWRVSESCRLDPTCCCWGTL